jgi:multicomponent Na+:H+ antiporter subunit A
MPLTALAVATATMSMAGFPLFFGFIGKEIMYHGCVDRRHVSPFCHDHHPAREFLMTAVAGIILLGPFTGKRPDPLAEVVEAPLPMVFGPGLMGGLCLLFGLIPWWVSDYLIEPAVRAFSVVEKEVQLAIFHGFNTPLLLSIVTLTLGGMIYFARKKIRPAVAAAVAGHPPDRPARV